MSGANTAPAPTQCTRERFVIRALRRAVQSRHRRSLGSPRRPSPLLREAQRTVRVIDIVASLDHEQRQPSSAELAELAAWQGWGSLTPAYGARPEQDEGWNAIRDALDKRLTADRRAAVVGNGIQTSFFTNPTVVAAAWRLAVGLGFEGGRVLDIGCGTGAFMATAPAGLPLELTGIEPDPLAARIAAWRVPQARIATRELQDVRLADASCSLVIGNVPFGNPDTANYRRTRGLSLHNYCLWRALQAVRPGGLVVVVTCRYTLDATSPTQRQRLAELGELVGAIRLPSRTFSSAGTTAVTDLVAFRRRAQSDAWHVEPRWERAVPGVAPGIPVNEYFAARRHLMLGELSVRRGTYRPTLAVRAVEPVDRLLLRATGDVVRAASAAATVRRQLARHCIVTAA
jgi:SAM-dependent methyltransferase